LYPWLVKGWIAKHNGHKVNWATTTTPAQEKNRWQNSSSLPKAHIAEKLECCYGSQRLRRYDLPNA